MSLLERLRAREGSGDSDSKVNGSANGEAVSTKTPSPSAPSGGAPREGDTMPVATNPAPAAPKQQPAPPAAAGGVEPRRATMQQRAQESNKQAAEARVRRHGPANPNAGNTDLKMRVHAELIERLDLSAVGEVGVGGLSEEIKQIIGELLETNGIPLSRNDKLKLIAEITSEVLGLGPLDALIRDDTISDILVNSPSQVYIERKGKLELADCQFRDDEHLLQIIDRIVSQVGRRVDASSPLVDARLQDGSRVNAIIPPIALDGPCVSIRRFGKDPLLIGSLIQFKSVAAEMAEFMDAIVKARLNVIVSGGTGSGKTTLLNCLSSFIPHDERIVTIEDAAEIQIQQPHVVRLETRPQNLEGRGEITARDLVRNALRMRPDRIVVGETRGAEALDMLQAMNTGHDGSKTTIHANNPRDALSRLEMLILMSGVDLPVQAMRQQISSAVDVIIQAARMKDGSRKIVKITEVVGMEGDMITSQDIFQFVTTGLDEDGKVVGYHECCGIRPKCIERLNIYGSKFDPNFFAHRRLN